MTAKKKHPGRKPAHLTAAGPKPHGRDAVWVEIRKQRTFTYRSLCDATDIPNKTIRDYVQGLIAAGVVIPAGQRLVAALGNSPTIIRIVGLADPRHNAEIGGQLVGVLEVIDVADAREEDGG